MSNSPSKFTSKEKLILVFGRDGQVGRALQICLKNSKIPVVFLGRSDCDLRSESSILEVIDRYQPQVIINTAAYTAVDKAESEHDQAFAINAKAPELLAQYMAGVDQGLMIHFSTDYVFSDTQTIAYKEDDLPGPVEHLSVYGQTKLLGEQQIQLAYEAVDFASKLTSRFYVLRTSWVYGDGANFIKTIWNLAQSKQELRVVNDQIGVPTSANWLASVCESLINKDIDSGIYHAVPDGEVSWFELSKLILGYLQQRGVKITLRELLPIPAKDYPTAAKRPYNSKLNNQKLKNAIPSLFQESDFDWKNQVINYLDSLNEKHI